MRVVSLPVFFTFLVFWFSGPVFADDHRPPEVGFYREVNSGPRWLQTDKDNHVLTNMGGENHFHPGPIGAEKAILFNFPHRLKWDPAKNVFTTNGNYIIDLAYQGGVYECFIEVILLADFYSDLLDITLKAPSVVIFDKPTKKCFLSEWKTKVYAFEKIGGGVVPVAWREWFADASKPKYYVVEFGEQGDMKIDIERASSWGNIALIISQSVPPSIEQPIAEITISDAPKTIRLRNLAPGKYFVTLQGRKGVSFQLTLDGHGITKAEPISTTE